MKQPKVDEGDETLIIEESLERKSRGKLTWCYLVKYQNYSPIDAKWMEGDSGSLKCWSFI